MKIVYGTILATLLVSLTVAGVFLVVFLPFQEQDTSLLQDQSASFASLLPAESDQPHGLSAESISLFAQNVPDDIRAVPATPAVIQPTTPPVIEQQAAVIPLHSVKASAPVSYVYFYTGVPVRPVPTATVVYSAGLTPATQVPIVRPVVAPVPVMQSYSVPVFVPRVVPSRVGAPKLVYTNGVVIKPQVYYPRQPVRNALRGVTP